MLIGSGIWASPEARELIRRRDAGGLVRLGRRHRGWRQTDLGACIGCSPSTVSRLESNKRVLDLELLRAAAEAVGVPSPVLAAACGLATVPVPAPTTVARDAPRDTEEEPMHRRTLLTAAGAAIPASLLGRVDEALAITPPPSGDRAPLDARLARARHHFDAGRHLALLPTFPDLLGDAHQAAARSRSGLDYARLSACYSLETQVLSKIGKYDTARITADRATTYASLSGSPIAAAAAARELAVVLRHQDQASHARQLVLDAATTVESTGLVNQAQAAAYAQMLCTTAYNAAHTGDRGQALVMIAEARRVVRGLPAMPPPGRLFPVSPAQVELYAVGVHWALGDPGAALDAGRKLRPAMFPTPERTARMHTDRARVHWMAGQPDETAEELLAAASASRAEVRDRPSIRRIADGLVVRHPRAAGARELSLTLTR
ncbi:helix-turn-helix transcriptional regulator [Streptomyces synnematoformans]|uniref:HTH cro/C1-type domain-containing protein n=1 Tax=Streptomyces synnematoformans TaxID=415721 RepID=A0ABN2YTH7_9ACTN